MNHFCADAITGCTRTKENTLSVWHSENNDFNDEHVKNLIIGLAIDMDQPAKIDLLWLEESQLKNSGLEIEYVSAKNIYEDINKYHKDIINMDYNKLGIVASCIVKSCQDDSNTKLVTRPEIIKLVVD